ncbi:NAD(P)/FAD-dependent oxidoreductase [Marivita sp.]|uniref:NAD(P)/FAD-dependent oxidoreductase n=1 Tax=Marivita sp. TaxID=2003365 RepID=UPI003F6B5856
MDIAIIGSGITGLACARRLTDAGLMPKVFDKGRGIGGRLATRRADGGLQFDHGAQMIPQNLPAFGDVLEQAEAAGFVTKWAHSDGSLRHVGIPGMTGFAKFLGQDLDMHQATEIKSLTQDVDGWGIYAEQSVGRFDRVVCTAPSPQTAKLAGHALTQSLDTVSYDPSLTLMVALNCDLDAPATQTNPTDAFAWVAHDSAKPGRSSHNCWVVQASAEWSNVHLELTKDQIATLMLDLFLTHFGLSPTDVVHASAHRWRYAFVTKPLGQPFVTSPDNSLYAGGDWCLGPRIEHAWQSGTAIADDILRAL